MKATVERVNAARAELEVLVLRDQRDVARGTVTALKEQNFALTNEVDELKERILALQEENNKIASKAADLNSLCKDMLANRRNNG